MATVEIYTTPMCPYCYRAKRLLEQQGRRVHRDRPLAVPGSARRDGRAVRRAAHRAADLRRWPRVGRLGRSACARRCRRLWTPDCCAGRAPMICFALHCGQRPYVRGLVPRRRHLRPAGRRGRHHLPDLRRQRGAQSDDGAGGGALGLARRRRAARDAGRGRSRRSAPDHVKAAVMMAMLRKMREHVEKNFDNVGERFPEEARRIHYGEAEEREIFGQATPRGSQGADRGGHHRAAAAGPAQARRLIGLSRGRPPADS